MAAELPVEVVAMVAEYVSESTFSRQWLASLTTVNSTFRAAFTKYLYQHVRIKSLGNIAKFCVTVLLDNQKAAYVESLALHSHGRKGPQRDDWCSCGRPSSEDEYEFYQDESDREDGSEDNFYSLIMLQDKQVERIHAQLTEIMTGEQDIDWCDDWHKGIEHATISSLLPLTLLHLPRLRDLQLYSILDLINHDNAKPDDAEEMWKRLDRVLNLRRSQVHPGYEGLFNSLEEVTVRGRWPWRLWSGHHLDIHGASSTAPLSMVATWPSLRTIRGQFLTDCLDERNERRFEMAPFTSLKLEDIELCPSCDIAPQNLDALVQSASRLRTFKYHFSNTEQYNAMDVPALQKSLMKHKESLETLTLWLANHVAERGVGEESIMNFSRFSQLKTLDITPTFLFGSHDPVSGASVVSHLPRSLEVLQIVASHFAFNTNTLDNLWTGIEHLLNQKNQFKALGSIEISCPLMKFTPWYQELSRLKDLAWNAKVNVTLSVCTIDKNNGFYFLGRPLALSLRDEGDLQWFKDAARTRYIDSGLISKFDRFYKLDDSGLEFDEYGYRQFLNDNWSTNEGCMG